MLEAILVGIGFALVSTALGVDKLQHIIMFTIGANAIFWTAMSIIKGRHE